MQARSGLGDIKKRVEFVWVKSVNVYKARFQPSMALNSLKNYFFNRGPQSTTQVAYTYLCGS